LVRIAGENDAELLVEERLAGIQTGLDVFDPAEIDLLITLGGDGTLLRGARLVAAGHTPVVGINLGHLGFLTSVPLSELAPRMDDLFAGRFWMDVRSTLDVRVSGAARDGESAFVALNDAVLHKG